MTVDKIPDLAISAAKVAAIIAKARQFDEGRRDRS